MYNLEQTGRFKKDVKLAKKRGLNMQLLDAIVTSLVLEGKLPPINKPHLLKEIILVYGNTTYSLTGYLFGSKTKP